MVITLSFSRSSSAYVERDSRKHGEGWCVRRVTKTFSLEAIDVEFMIQFVPELTHSGVHAGERISHLRSRAFPTTLTA